MGEMCLFFCVTQTNRGEKRERERERETHTRTDEGTRFQRFHEQIAHIKHAMQKKERHTHIHARAHLHWRKHSTRFSSICHVPRAGRRVRLITNILPLFLLELLLFFLVPHSRVFFFEQKRELYQTCGSGLLREKKKQRESSGR